MDHQVGAERAAFETVSGTAQRNEVVPGPARAERGGEVRGRAVAWSESKRLLDLEREQGGDPAALAAGYAALGIRASEEPLEHALAMVALRQALALDPRRADAHQALARLEALAGGGWVGEVRALLAEAAVARQRRQAASLHLRAAALRVAYDGAAPGEVVDLCERALLLAPEATGAIDLVERSLGARQDWKALSEALQRLARSVRDRSVAAEIHVRLAAIDLVRFADPLLAVEALERALTLDPRSTAATQLAFELHLEAGRHAEALSALERHLAVVPDRREHLAAWRLSAAELAIALGDEARARSHLDGAHRLEPDSPRVAAARAPLLEKAGEWSALADALEVQLRGAPSTSERAALLRRLAGARDRLPDPEQAVAAWRAAAALVPEAEEGLEAALLRAGHAGEVLEAARRRLAAAGGEAAHRALLEKLARLQFATGDAAGAVASWRELAAREDAQPGTLRSCSEALEQLAESLPRDAGEERARLLVELALLRDDRLSDRPGAFAAAVAALRSCPHYVPAREACERFARAAGWMEELVRVLDDAAARCQDHPDHERALRASAAEIARERGDEAEAARQLERCLTLDPGDRRAMTALTGALAALERWEPCCALLDRQASLADVEERTELFVRLGDILGERLSDPARAAEAYRRALDGATSEERRAILQRLADALAAVGDHMGESAALDELARAAGAEGARAARRRALLLATALGDPLQAVEPLGRALLADPADGEVTAALQSLARRGDPAAGSAAAEALRAAAEATGDRRALLSALELVAQRAPEPAAAAAAGRQAARIWGGELGQWSMAVAALERAVRATPRDEALRRELCAAARAGNAGEVARFYSATVLPALEGADAAAAWRELAELHEVSGGAEEAARAWAESLRHAPGARDALAALVRLHRAAGRDRERVEACLALAGAAGDEAEMLDAWREAAEVLEGPLDDAAAAAGIWARIAALAIDDPAPRDALERLFMRLDRPGDLAGILEWRRARPGGADDLELAFRLAELRRVRLGEHGAALCLLEEVLHREPRHAGARTAMSELAAIPGDAGRDALARLDALLRQDGEHAPRVMARERRLAAVADEPERRQLHLEIRSILERDLDQCELAFAAAARALPEGGLVAADAQPDLERLAAATGLLEQLGEVYQSAASAASGTAEALPLWRRAARIRAGQDDPQPAIAVWSRLLELSAEDGEALAALEDLYARAGDTARLAEVVRRRAALAGTSGAEILLAGGVRLAALGDDQRAAAMAEEALTASPTSAPVLSFLADLYQRTGERDRLARVLRAQADLSRGDPVVRHATLIELARLVEDGDGRAALDVYAEVLAEERLHRDALAGVDRLLQRTEVRDPASRILEEIHRAQGDARRLAAVLELRLESADAAEQGPLLSELAVLRERLGQPLEAFRARARAWRERAEPCTDALPVLHELERLAAAAGAFEELAGVYEEAIARGPPGLARDELRRRLAALLADRLDRHDAAARVLESLAAETPEVEVLAALARMYRRQGALRELAGALRRQAEIAPSAGTRKDLLHEVANIMAEQLCDREGAMEAYRQILSIDPEDPNALRLLGGLLDGAERWDELVGVLGREVDLAERRPNLVAEAAELRFRMGRIRQQRLADTAGALQCYRGVLERVPRHPASLAALEEIAAGGGASAVEAATLLEPVYEQEGEHAKLVRTLEARLATAADARSRSALLERIAEIQASGLRSPELAFLTAARAVREDPDSAASIAAAARYAEVAGLRDELASLLSEVADRLHDTRARLELRRQVAHLTARAGDPRRAAEAWGRVLEISPEDEEALGAVSDAHRTAGDLDSLAQALRRRSAVVEEPSARVPVLAELAQVQERLQDHAGAMATLRRLLDDDPGDRVALAALDRLCTGAEKWVELADVLGREIAAADAAGAQVEALGFRQRLAELKQARLLDRDGALALYEQILAARPEDRQALERVEAMLQRDAANTRAAGLLERAYASTGAWAQYAAVLELRAGERPDPVERKALFLELAEIQERKLGSAELAFIALCRAFRDDPADPAVRAELQRLAAATGHGEELAAVLEDELEELPSAVAAEVALTLGSLHEAQGDPRTAIGWLERSRRLDPPAGARALAALDRLYRATGDMQGLAEVLDAEADVASGEERAAFLFRLGQLCEEQLRDPARAAHAYESLVTEQPAHGAALRALEGIHEATGRMDALAENLAAQRELASDAASRLRLTARLAATTQALGRDDDAVALWREALALDGRHEAALAALEVLLERQQRWPELAELLATRLSATADRREAARINEKLGAVLADRMGDVAGAIAAYHGVLDADPRNRRALEALRDIHERQGNLEALASVYRRLVPLQEDAAGVRSVRMQLAEVLLGVGKKVEAAEQGRRALELEGNGEQELARLSRIFEIAGAPQEMVKAVEARATLLASSERRDLAVEAWLVAAEIWIQQLGKPEASCAALEKVLELAPARREAWSRLKDLYARLGDWRACARVSDLFTAHMTDPAERLTTLKEVAEIHEKRLGQKEMAFISLCRAFAEDPGDEAVAAAAHRLAGETHAWDELGAVYEQVAHDAPPPVKARLLLELGKLRDEQLDDVEGAETAFRGALELDAASAAALDALTGLFTRRGRLHDLVIALEHKLEAAAELDEKKATLMEMARIYEGQLADPGEAIASLKRVLELDGCDAGALELLAGLYRRQGRWADLAGILARTRDLTPDAGTRVSCQLQLAGLHENELGDDEAAIEAYRAVLAVDDAQRDAFAGLERLYAKLDRFAELNGICERQVALATDPREKVRLLLKSAAIWEERLHDNKRAIEQAEAVLGLDPANGAALKTLEALYRRERLPEKLIGVLQQRAALCRDQRELVTLDVEIGEVWWKELGSAEHAESMFTHALQLDPQSRAALSGLARLHELGGRWNLALEMLRREAALEGPGSDQVELQSRIARIEREELEDPAAAKAAYACALDADPGHVPSLQALREIARAEGDRDAYLRLLVTEARYSEVGASKARLLQEAARIQQEERYDVDAAMRLYEEALRAAPGLLEAARPLADLHVARGDWARAEKVLDVVVAQLAQEGGTQELCRQSYRLGYVAEKLGNVEKALDWYRRAYELDATYLPALEGLGALLVQRQLWDEALRIHQAILIHHRDGLTDLEVVETYWRIGDLQARLGQGDRAANSFEKALETDAGHERSRRGLIAALEAGGDWAGAVEHRRKLLPSLDGAAKRDMYLAIASICREHLQDPFQAVDACTEAARIDPGSAEAIESLLALHRETKQGQKAADVLSRLLESPELASDRPRAARLHHALAGILRDELQDETGAARELERALDADPRFVQALAELEALLSRSGEWRALEQAYVRMIQRLPRTPDLAAPRLAVWRALGELYRRVLHEDDGARMAFEVLAKAQPDDVAAAAAHAELAAKVPGHETEAIAAHRRWLVLAGDCGAPLSRLVHLHAARKSYDEAYCAAQARVFLASGASDEEGQVVSRLRRFARDTATGSLDDTLWGKVLHPRVRGPLPSILALLVRDAWEVFGQQPRDLGLNPRKDELDVAASMLFFVNMYRHVARTLGMHAPRLFRSSRPEERLRVLPLRPPALVVGESLFQERPKKELWFTIGKAMAFLRPELMLARFMPHDQLDALFQAAASLGTSRFAVSADPHLVQRLRRRLENVLPESTRTQTLKLLARQYCDEQRPGDVRAYMDAAELTSNRLGALLAGDLEVVRRMVVTEKAAVAKLNESVRLRDLVLFSTSQDHGELREHLGLSVVVPATS